jgi:ATP-dependent Clp protease ATP-binding subunit ClpA
MPTKQDFDTSKVDKNVQQAYQIAVGYKHEYLLIEHILAALLDDPAINKLIQDLEGNIDEIKQDLSTLFSSGLLPTVAVNKYWPKRTNESERCIQRSVATTMFSGRRVMEPTDLFVSLLYEEQSHAFYFISKQNIDQVSVKEYLTAEQDEEETPESGFFSKEQAQSRDNKHVKNREQAEKILAKYCVNLNEEASKGKIDPLIGREMEVSQLVLTTARRTKNNCVLTGEPGVGKTSIVEGLAKLIVEGNVPEILKGSTVYSLDVGNLVAGTKFRGDFEERMKQVLKALSFVDKPILFIDEIHMIMGAGSGGQQSSLDVANLLKPALSKGELRCIGSTTYEEFRKHFEKDRALLRRFQKLDIFEPSVEDTKRIIRGLSKVYEEYHGVQYEVEALDQAVELTSKYVNDRFLPDKAIDVIDAAGARQRVAPASEKVSIINVDLIEQEVSRIAKIPPRTVKESETDKLSKLLDNLKSNVFGQDNALHTLEDTVVMCRAGLREPNKPLGCYLFTGPTGVGKTESAKTLADTLGIPLLRYDMSEYMEKHSVSKLIGSPPGYVGYGDGASGSGQLINDVEKHPYCVLLLDEIEKAHPDVYNVFLQVMDNGKLTSSSGKSVSMKNVVLIMTSNAGAAELEKNAMGFGREDRDGEDDTVINRTFTPEFRNRLDAIVKFKRLTQNTMHQVVKKFITQLNAMGLDKKVRVWLQPDAVDWLAKQGYDPKMGARPLSRVIDQNIKRPLSREMLFGCLKDGGVAWITVGTDNQLKIKYRSI